MQALILVGGHGTRLRPVTLTLPKPVIPLVDRPFLRYMIDWLARHGVDDVVMACGFLPDQLRAAFGDEIPGGPTLHYVEEPEPRGTAGAIKFAEDLLQDRFFALNGDSLTDLDLTALLDRHVSSGARATLGVHPVDDITGLGLVRSDPDTGEILEFLEKPDPATVDTNEVSAGMYVLEKEVLDLVPPHQDVSIEREVWPRLVGDGLYSQRLEGYWMDIGTPDRYLAACWDILGRKVESEPGKRSTTRVATLPPTRTSTPARRSRVRPSSRATARWPPRRPSARAPCSAPASASARVLRSSAQRSIPLAGSAPAPPSSARSCRPVSSSRTAPTCLRDR